MAALLALIALILEILHWATTRDSSLAFYALVLVTLAILLPIGLEYWPATRRA